MFVKITKVARLKIFEKHYEQWENNPTRMESAYTHAAMMQKCRT